MMASFPHKFTYLLSIKLYIATTAKSVHAVALDIKLRTEIRLGPVGYPGQLTAYAVEIDRLTLTESQPSQDNLLCWTVDHPSLYFRTLLPAQFAL